MRILLISYYFPPYNTIGAVRTGRTAQHLLQLGHELRVLTAACPPMPQTLNITIDPDIIHATPWVNLNWAAEAVMGGREAFATKGFDPMGMRQLISRYIKPLYTNLFNIPDPQVGWIPYAIAEGRRIAAKWFPDLILASGMPFSGFVVAASLSRHTGVPWVAEYRDLWCDNPYYQYFPIRRRFERLLERNLLNTASACVTISEPLAAILRKATRLPTAVIPNGVDPETITTGKRRKADPSTLRIVYTGTVIPGRRDPTIVFHALARLVHEGISCRINFYGRNLASAIDLAQRYGVADYVSFAESVPHDESLCLQHEADVLLALLWNNPAEEGTVPAKLFEYLAALRPILMIGLNHGVAADLIRQRRAGTVCTTADEVYVSLKTWIIQKRRFGHIPDHDPALVDGITRRDQVLRLVTFLSQVQALSVAAAHTLAAETSV